MKIESPSREDTKNHKTEGENGIQYEILKNGFTNTLPGGGSKENARGLDEAALFPMYKKGIPYNNYRGTAFLDMT